MTVLQITVKASDDVSEYHEVRVGWPADRSDWTLRGDVDASYLTAWESRIGPYVEHT